MDINSKLVGKIKLDIIKLYAELRNAPVVRAELEALTDLELYNRVRILLAEAVELNLHTQKKYLWIKKMAMYYNVLPDDNSGRLEVLKANRPINEIDRKRFVSEPDEPRSYKQYMKIIALGREVFGGAGFSYEERGHLMNITKGEADKKIKELINLKDDIAYREIERLEKRN